MNEKIKELAEQCEVWHRYEDYDACEVDAEKFAKLILQEAMDIVFEEVSYNSDWACANATIARVKEHFEIE